jgi:uncharacterized protein YjbJ (UPF0337 family)
MDVTPRSFGDALVCVVAHGRSLLTASRWACEADLQFEARTSHPLTTKEHTMNKDQIKGTVKDITGKVQEAAGKTMNNKEMQLKGLQKQVVGSAEKAIGDAKQDVKNASDAVKHAVKAP